MSSIRTAQFISMTKRRPSIRSGFIARDRCRREKGKSETEFNRRELRETKSLYYLRSLRLLNSYSGFGLADAVFFVFQLALQFSFVVGELALDFLECFLVAGGGFVHFTFQRNFTFGDFGGVFGIEFRQFLLLGSGEFDGR